MKKRLLFLAVGLLVLVIAAAVILIASIDNIARQAIQRGGTYALGTSTTVSSVHVGLLSGKLSISGLNVANPPNPAGGFKSDHFLKLGSGSVAATLSTLRQPTVELPRLALEDIDVNLEKKGDTTNYKTILDHLSKVAGGEKSAPPSSDEKRYIIHDLDIQDVVVRVDLIGGPGMVGELTSVTVPIEQIKLKDVGKTGTGVRGTGVTLPELAEIVVTAVLAAAREKGGGVIPGEILSDLGKLADLRNLEGLKMEVIGDVAAKVDELGKKAVEEGRKKVDDALGKVRDLLPADKKK